MAFFSDPAKQFQFRIAIQNPPGVARLQNPFQVQEVDEPDDESEVDEHGENSHIIKTAGMTKYSMLSVRKIQPSTQLDSFIWAWRRFIMNVRTGGGAIPSLYKTTITVQQLGADNQTPIQTNIYYGAWPNKINGKNYRRAESGNTIESIEFCIDERNDPALGGL